MRKNKGFTLIELLAVIVVLGLISAITVPNVIKSSKDSKKKSYEVSVNNLVKSLNSMVADKKATLTPFSGCSYDFGIGDNTCTDLDFSGQLPDGGSLYVDDNGNVNGSVGYNDYVFEVRNNREYEMKSGVEFTFDYTGFEQVFPIFTSGNYKLETWGAQGGNGGLSNYGIGGYGGYSIGIINLSIDNNLYINVGGQGSLECVGSPSGYCLGGYNGGGNSIYQSADLGGVWGSGGGATHIGLRSGLLYSLENYKDQILIVSGGGGGAYSNYDAGSAGGYVGSSGYSRSGYTQSTGGTQVSGGTGYANGLFGKAFEYTYTGGNFSGGGGGFYGGSSARATSSAGGSGYIGNSLLSNKVMYCYDCDESDQGSTLTISTTGDSELKDIVSCPDGYSEIPVSKCAKAGNGYVKITYLGID